MSKIMVGMSGGVDSSVCALLLHEQGFDVTGVTLRMFSDDDIINSGTCGTMRDSDDAKSVAQKLGFEHIVFNFRDCFREKVMKSFAECYISGKTPNPCIECNRYVKFGEMLRKAVESGFDYIATGHYASIVFDEGSGRYLLKRPKDRSKDQTYVLYSLTQEQLARVIFPLGNLEKAQVREIAEKYGLVNADKPDSQDICFVPDGKYSDFIKKFADYTPTEGNFINMDGDVIGTHRGIINYTIGQRKGLGIALGRPAYVVRKNVLENTITIGDEKDLYTRRLTACDVNLISVAEITEPMRITAKTRYNQKEQPATLFCEGGVYIVEFDEPQRAVTSGQAVVFYDGENVVGGGTIV